MKRYVLSIIAVGLAIGSVAFSKIHEKNMVDYYWYKRSSADTYVADGHGPNPMASCPGGSVICAKGFSSEQTPSTIKDTTTAQATRLKANQ